METLTKDFAIAGGSILLSYYHLFGRDEPAVKRAGWQAKVLLQGITNIVWIHCHLFSLLLSQFFQKTTPSVSELKRRMQRIIRGIGRAIVSVVLCFMLLGFLLLIPRWKATHSPSK